MLKRAAALAAAVAAVLSWSAPAFADEQGFSARIGQAPVTFTIGQGAQAVTAVVSTTRDLKRCQKIRWSLTVTTDGVSLDQVRVSRIEGGKVAQVRTQVTADAARIVDQQVDDGQLCQNQNVTGEWAVAFTGPDDGTVTFTAHALSRNGQELATAGVTSRVVTTVANKPTESATASASPSESVSPTPSFSAEPTAAAVLTPSDAPSTVDPAAAAANTSGLNVLLPGLIVGAVLVFLGVALLLRLRARNRKSPAWAGETQSLPTGFYEYPRRNG